MNDVGLTFYDVEQAIGRENITISAEDLLTGGLRRTVRIVGEFAEAEAFGDIIVKSEFQKTVYRILLISIYSIWIIHLMLELMGQTSYR